MLDGCVLGKLPSEVAGMPRIAGLAQHGQKGINDKPGRFGPDQLISRSSVPGALKGEHPFSTFVLLVKIPLVVT